MAPSVATVPSTSAVPDHITPSIKVVAPEPCPKYAIPLVAELGSARSTYPVIWSGAPAVAIVHVEPLSAAVLWSAVSKGTTTSISPDMPSKETSNFLKSLVDAVVVNTAVASDVTEEPSHLYPLTSSASSEYAIPIWSLLGRDVISTHSTVPAVLVVVIWVAEPHDAVAPLRTIYLKSSDVAVP